MATTTAVPLIVVEGMECLIVHRREWTLFIAELPGTAGTNGAKDSQLTQQLYSSCGRNEMPDCA